MKAFVVLLLCLFCLFCVSGCGGHTLQGTWKVNSPSAAAFQRISLTAVLNEMSLDLPFGVEVEFRSDGSIISGMGKAEGLTWHGDYICRKAVIKKLRDARTKQLTRERQATVTNGTREFHNSSSPEEEFANSLKSYDRQLEDLKNGKVMEGDAYFPWATGVDKKDISESADKVEVRIHWVDADHFDLGSTSFSRVKLPK